MEPADIRDVTINQYGTVSPATISMGYVGEHRARGIRIAEHPVFPDVIYELRFKAANGAEYFETIEEQGTYLFPNELLQKAGSLEMQWIAKHIDPEVDFVVKSAVFSITISRSLNDGIAVPTWETANDIYQMLYGFMVEVSAAGGMSELLAKIALIWLELFGSRIAALQQSEVVT